MPEDNEDKFIQRRLLVASVLSALAIMFYVYVSAPRGLPPAERPAAEQPAEPPATDPSAAEQAPPEQPAEPEASKPAPEKPPETKGSTEQPVAEAERKLAAGEQQIVVESDTYLVTLSNRGGVVTSWILKDYLNAKGEPLDLVHAGEAGDHNYPFALVLPGGEPAIVNEVLFVANEGPDRRVAPTSVTFEYSDGTHSARKAFRFEQEGYVVGVETDLAENGAGQPHLIAWNGGFGDTAQTNDARNSTTYYYDSSTGKLQRNKAADAEEARITNQGEFAYAGIDDLFFAAAFLPREPTPVRMETSTATIVPVAGGKEQVFAALAVGGAEHNDFRAFVGPKSLEILGSVRPELRTIVDFGWLAFLAEPMFWMLRWIHEHLVANWGWSIILVTVFINLVMFPLKWKSTKSMKRMQALQPLVKQINEKYKGLSIRDPKKAQQNEELMALYKKHGVNPMGGCLPMVLQLPFFISFYYVLSVAIEMRHAGWLWVADLSAPEQIPIRVLPLAMVGTQFWQQAITPQPTVDPAQVKMMKFMPLMMGFLFYGFSSGLVLFWLTGNLVGVVQQVILNRFPSEPIEVEQPRRRRKKK